MTRRSQPPPSTQPPGARTAATRREKPLATATPRRAGPQSRAALEQVEEALRESELRYRSLVEQIPLVVYRESPDATTWWASPQFSALFGRDVTPDAPYDFVHPDDIELSRSDPPPDAPNPDRYVGDYRVVTPNGIRWVHDEADLIRDAEGGPLFWQGYIVDITDRRAMEEALRETNQTLQALVDASPVSIVSLDAEARVVTWNRAAELMFGWSASEVIGRALPIVPACHREAFDALFAEIGAGAGLVSREAPRIRKDGSTIYVAVSASPLFDTDGRFAGSIAVLEDVTIRREEREALRQVRERLEMIINRAPVAIVTLDTDGNVTSWNAAAKQIFGWDEDEIIGLPYPAIPGDADPGDTGARRISSGGEPFPVTDVRRVRKDGSNVFVSLSSAPLTDADGAFSGDVVIIADSTERRSAEAERDRLSAVVEQSTDCVIVTDVAGSVVYVNPALEGLTGYSRDELIGQSPWILSSGQNPDEVYIEIRRAMAGRESWAGTLVDQRKDGTTYEFSAVVSPIRNSAGEVVNFLIAGRDITREHQLEQQMLQAQKMEAVGRLAGGVAHDFNNLLMAIGGYTDLLMAQTPENDPRREYAAQILKAAEQAGALTQQLLAFSRKQVLTPTVLDVSAVVGDIERMLGRLIGEDIEFQTRTAGEPAMVRADRSQIEQVVMNLVVNARDAMPAGGRIAIAVECVAAGGEGSPSDLQDAPAGPYVALTVEDTGIGMDQGVQARIFEPFFTTKGPGHGTGLGLSTVYGIVSQSGGRITVRSTPGKGSAFTIYLPRVVKEEEVAPPLPIADSGVPGGSETILLVEDETGVRNLVKAVLERYGYTIIEARSGPEALRLAPQHDCIDLLLTDVVMPRMSGRELAERLTGQRPALNVLYMSGYTDDEVVRHGVLEEEVDFIQKPFRPEVIARRIRHILDRRAAAA